MHPIIFPNLNLSFDINPVAFSILGKDIYFYGIIIVAGIIIALFLMRRDNGKYGLKWDDVFDFLMWTLVFGIISARIYYVIFQWEYYKSNLNEIYKIRHGGIAIYGGIIGALLTAFFYCRKKKISFLSLCDYCAPYLPLVQAIGRWGNFVNREAYGAVTDSFLKMGIWDSSVGAYIYVHPTFLYESLINFAIFIFLFVKSRKNVKKGELFYLYMFLYGIGRAIVEGMRADSLYMFNFRISQVLAVLFAVFFGIILLKQKFQRKS